MVDWACKKIFNQSINKTLPALTWVVHECGEDDVPDEGRLGLEHCVHRLLGDAAADEENQLGQVLRGDDVKQRDVRLVELHQNLALWGVVIVMLA